VSDRADPDLARLLGSLEAPPAKGRFHERLWERIDAAEARPLDHPLRRPLFRRPRLVAAALAAAAVAVWVAVSLVGWPLTREHGMAPGPPPAVAQVIDKVRLRLDSCRSLSAVFTYQRAGDPLFQARILATSDGRVRTTAISEPDGSWRLPSVGATLGNTPGLHIEVTSLPDGTRTEAWNSEDGPAIARTINTPVGPPDAGGSGLFPAEYSGLMSPIAIAGSTVSFSTYQGRRVLVVSAPVRPASALTPMKSASSTPRYDRVSMTIDRNTWLPVRVVRTYHGTVVEVWGLSDVRLDHPLLASDFAVQLPSSAALITGADQGFRRLSLKKASAAVRGRLFVPETLPGGFALSLVAARTPKPTLQKPWLSNESGVASLVYRNGFRSIVVTTRSFNGALPDPGHDPFVGSSFRGPSGATQAFLRAGGLSGVRALLSAHPLELPHLWVLHDGLLVTVAGDVTRRELLRVAESLDLYSVWRTHRVFTAYVAATKANDLGRLRHLYADGVQLVDNAGSNSVKGKDDVAIRNNDMAEYLASGKTVSALVGRRGALWEAWPGSYVAIGGWYTPDAVAEVVTVRGERIAREDFFWIGGPNTRASKARPHPARLRTPPGPGDTSSAARQIALDYASALRHKDAARLGSMSSADVRFLDVGCGDHGRRPALHRRYQRMFAFPADLAFTGLRTFSGPGWAVVRWTARSDSLGYEDVTGLTVLEIRNGRIARETLYCAKDKMPFR
jgi:ketosteroid isomerase-like protein